MGKVIGIDLGTTNSVVSVYENGKAKILENPEGNRTTPSVVAFKDGEIIVGDAAKRQALTNPDTIVSVKRFMGTNHEFEIGGKKYKPEQISGMILAHLKEYAEKKLGEPVSEAIITVPAYFDDSQRNATKNSGKIAGLNVQRIINEPTAAALAYGIEKLDKEETILVYDFGGGTFDVSVLEISNGTFEVLATAGDNKLGGDDLDNIIVDFLVDGFKQEYGIDLITDKMALQRMKEEAEKAKKNLSSVLETTISLPFIASSDAGPLHIETKFSRTQFEELVGPAIDKTIEPIEQAINDSGVSIQDIDEIILVGGTTRIPYIRTLIETRLNKKPNSTVNPDEVVAMGAAIQASVLTGEVTDILLLDVTPLSLGVETRGGVMTVLIPRNSSIPTTSKRIFSTVVANQSKVEVKVFQGERYMVEDNKFLGNLLLSGIDKAPAGIPQIEVSFSIDVNGILDVSALDKKTGNVKKVTIENSETLSDDEIDRIIREASSNKDADKKRMRDSILSWKRNNSTAPAPTASKPAPRPAAPAPAPRPAAPAPAPRPAAPAPQGRPPQGRPPQGRPPQGRPPQGRPPQGRPPQGRPPQGRPTQGRPAQGRPPQGRPPQSQKLPSAPKKPRR